jgi:hypothetical protein
LEAVRARRDQNVLAADLVELALDDPGGVGGAALVAQRVGDLRARRRLGRRGDPREREQRSEHGEDDGGQTRHGAAPLVRADGLSCPDVARLEPRSDQT